MKKIIERLKHGEWFVTCRNGGEFKYLKELCKQCNFKWHDGEDLDNMHDNDFVYPVNIGVDFCHTSITRNELCYCTDNFNYDRHKDNQIEDITDLVFNKKNIEYFVTTIEKEKLDLLLAMIRHEPLEKVFIGNEWIPVDYQEKLFSELDFLLDNFRIHSFNISQEIWNVVDPKFNYAAVDPGQMLWFYEYEPQYNEIDGGWDSTKGSVTSGNCFNIDLSKVECKNSLAKRPE